MSAQITHFDFAGAPNRIRELREAAKLTQKQLGSRIGVSKVTISELERDKMKLDVHYMRKISSALGVMPGDLLQVIDNPNSLSLEERKLVERLRTATAEQRAAVAGMIDVMVRPSEPAAHRAQDTGDPAQD